MSKISEALAKAKERTGKTLAPFSPGDRPHSPAREAALRQARRARRFWAVLLPLAVALTATLLWQRLGTQDDEPAPAASSDPQAPAAGPASPAGHAPVAPSPGAGTRPAPATTVPAGPAPAPRAELHRQVAALVITAVQPGEPPRLLYQGRVVPVGETVEGELVFAGLQDGQIVFRDRRGAAYLRRY